jgi:PQQ-like domain
MLLRLAAAAALAVGLPSAVAGVQISSDPGASVDAKLWVSRYNGPANGIDEAQALGVSPDGSKLFITGRSGPEYNFDYATVAYDASTGGRLWVNRYNGPDNNVDDATALGISPDGSKVFVTGTISAGGGDGFDFGTIAYDAATGARLWVKRYNSGLGRDDYATALGVSRDGSKVFVTGYSGGAFLDYSTVAYDAVAGTRMWVRHYEGFDSDAANALGVSADGSTVFVTGQGSGAGGKPDYTTVAYDAVTGRQRWVESHDGGAVDTALALAVSPDGSEVVVTGYSQRPGIADPDYATVAYDAATGTRLWVQRYSAPRDRSPDVAYALAVSPDASKVFVTGRAFYGPAPANYDYTTIAYDAASGTELWLKRYDGGVNGDDIASGVGVSPDGSKVFVTGQSAGSTSGDDYATVAYDAATGARQWIKVYNGPRNGTDDARALGVSPDGSKVFVTGRSEGSGSGFDYATVAYSTG